MPEQRPPPQAALRRATAHDVARLAGVSQPVVSRAFTEGASISAEAKARVLRAAADLGYRPNHIARSLITRRSRLVGIAMSYLENPFYPALLERLTNALAEAGYGVLLFTPPRGRACEPLLEEVLRTRVDALILASTPVSSRFAEECARARLPVVLVNRRTESLAASSVTGMNRQGGGEIAHRLAKAGHRRFAFIAGLDDSSTSREREQGFRQALADRGLPPPQRQPGGFTFEGARQAMRALLDQAPPPDAVFCANDYMALAALETTRTESTLRPGHDISIVGFDDIPAAAWTAFGLSTFSQPYGAMADRAAAMVLAQLDHPDAQPVHEVVAGGFIQRGSSRLPSSDAPA